MAESIRWDWLGRHSDDITRLTVEHLVLTGTAMGIAIAVALPVAFAVRGRRLPFAVAGGVADVLYTIPSLALFALLLPYLGIGKAPAVIGLAAYALTMLLRNAVVGLQGVPAVVKDAARGVGMTPRQLLWRVELPLALPAVITGVRLATVSTVGIATIAAFVGGGGLGELIWNDGIQRDLFLTPIVAGTVLTTLLAAVLDVALLGLERVLTPWARRGRA